VNPAPTLSALWQLPWLRVSLIIRRLELPSSSEDCQDDLVALLELRSELETSGWFN
jgi:hypothetical protein